MKIMRYFPLLALAVLGFIGYGLFKTSSFINKKVDAKMLLSQDSILKQNANQNQSAASANPITADTLSSPTSALTEPITASAVPSESKSNSVKNDVTATPHQTKVATADPASTDAKTSAISPIATTLATPKSVSKDAVSTKTTKEEPSKATTTKTIGQTRGVVKTPATQTTPNNSSSVTASTKITSSNNPTTLVAKGDVPKSASITAKKDVVETRFHVIIGSYAQEANANAKALAFEQKNNKKATIIKQGGYFRVCADEFEFAQSASQYAQKLKEVGENSLILKF